jgi:hypothetical protein
MKSQFNIIFLSLAIFSVSAQAQSDQKRNVPLFTPKFFGDNITISSQDNVEHKEGPNGVSFERNIRICSGVRNGQKVIEVKVIICSQEYHSIYNTSVELTLDPSIRGLVTWEGSLHRYVGTVRTDVPTVVEFTFIVNDATPVVKYFPCTLQITIPDQRFAEQYSLKVSE